jgi:hypothetical protein
MKLARILLVVVVTLSLALGAGMAVAGDKTTGGDHNEKYRICHIPPGNPSNAHIITVGSLSAVEHHVENHGDFLIEDREDKKKCLHYGEKKSKK